MTRLFCVLMVSAVLLMAIATVRFRVDETKQFFA